MIRLFAGIVRLFLGDVTDTEDGDEIEQRWLDKAYERVK